MIVHPIDEASPLRGGDRESLLADRSEIIISLTGVDETAAQPVHARFTFTANDLVWGGRFADVILREDADTTRLDLSRFHRIE